LIFLPSYPRSGNSGGLWWRRKLGYATYAPRSSQIDLDHNYLSTRRISVSPIGSFMDGPQPGPRSFGGRTAPGHMEPMQNVLQAPASRPSSGDTGGSYPLPRPERSREDPLPWSSDCLIPCVRNGKRYVQHAGGLLGNELWLQSSWRNLQLWTAPECLTVEKPWTTGGRLI
jgi:hypothetical protein